MVHLKTEEEIELIRDRVLYLLVKPLLKLPGSSARIKTIELDKVAESLSGIISRARVSRVTMDFLQLFAYQSMMWWYMEFR
jgi:hypothetical protein